MAEICENQNLNKTNLQKYHDASNSTRETNAGQSPREGPVNMLKSAFNKRVLTLSYDNVNEECLLPEVFLQEACGQLKTEVDSYLKVNYALKFNLELHALYGKPDMEDLEKSLLHVQTFPTKMKDIFDIKDFEEAFSAEIDKIIQNTEEFQTRDSGWTLVQLIKVELNLNKYQPLKGSSYIPLPRPIFLKKACLNVKNKDNYCFKWAVLSAIANINRNSSRTSAYKLNICSKTINCNGYCLDFKGLQFPLKLNDIAIFEENNPTISINVFGCEPENYKVVGPYYKTKGKKAKHINLLFLQENTNGHYVYIKNMSRLLRQQTTLHRRKVFICDDCLQHFLVKEELDKHIENECRNTVNVPKKDRSILEFKNNEKTTDVPFVIYANSSYIFQSNHTTIPQPYAFSYFIKCSFNNDLDKLRCFKGPNSPEKFIKSLIEDVNYLYSNYFTKSKPISSDLTEQENLDFMKNDSCHVCSEVISEHDKVKDHCQFSGKYKGPAHYFCIFNKKLLTFFPVIFQSFSAYDCQLFVNEFNNIDSGSINIIPKNKDSCISLSKTINSDIGVKLEIRFLDSFSFIPSKLADVVKHLTINDLNTFKSMYPDDLSKFNLLIKKAVFPYNYIDSVEKLSDTCLPSRDKFYNKLRQTECSLEDYKHAEAIWAKFECKTLKNYLILHMKTDVLLLTDVFQNFRSICKRTYGLDPCHYYSTAGFSWDAMLKTTKIKLCLLTDKSIISFLQKGIRGAVTQCPQRHSIANNKYLSDYKDQLPSKYIMHYEANNLYDWAMSQALPVGDFKWLSNVENFSLDSIPNDSNTGYILEVDLEYPKEIHDKHNSLPFCSDMKTPPQATEKKLVLDLNHKSEYVIYYKNLQQCLKHGLKLKKIHRILKFKQKDWLKKFISLKDATNLNSFGKYVYKILNYAVYDRAMGEGDKSTTIKLVNKWESDGKRLGARALIAKHEFNCIHIFDEDTVGVELDNIYSYYKPIYLEFTILELMKWKMYNFHYDNMMPKYNSNIELNYIDVNSFIYTIKTEDVYKDFKDQLSFADTGYDVGKKKVMLKEFVALRSKMYCIKSANFKETINVDCEKSNSCKDSSLSEHKYCLYNKKIHYVTINAFSRKLHTLYCTLFKDISSSYLDNKRYTCHDNINTLAWGHYKEKFVGYSVDDDDDYEMDETE
ncbi:uncharacterized protein LOC135949335 [Calliphora vicina]|uniref:uncharacterized protein LOC135949335 n=1 Tax=Calliphora vicina TaxID=7373 RepID=UPI00325B23FF